VARADRRRAERAAHRAPRHASVAGNSYYIADIRRTSPRRYLVSYENVDHPSVRVCALVHVDLAKWRRIGSGVPVPCK